AREKLLAVLDTVGARFPGDEWVAAQHVRYLIEAKRYGDAVRIADRCAGSGSLYLCRAFRAVALHDSGAIAAADSAFSTALTALRYGFDTWFVRDEPPAGSMSEAAVAGYREGGAGFNFVPASSVFASPIDLHADDWDLKLRSARTNYAPAYARRFRSLDRQQVAVFRRGDSALVVATYDI